MPCTIPKPEPPSKIEYKLQRPSTLASAATATEDAQQSQFSWLFGKQQKPKEIPWQNHYLKPSVRVQRRKEEEREEVHLKPVLREQKSTNAFEPPQDLEGYVAPLEKAQEKEKVQPPQRIQEQKPKVVENQKPVEKVKVQEPVRKPAPIVQPKQTLKPVQKPQVEEESEEESEEEESEEEEEIEPPKPNQTAKVAPKQQEKVQVVQTKAPVPVPAPQPIKKPVPTPPKEIPKPPQKVQVKPEVEEESEEESEEEESESEPEPEPPKPVNQKRVIETPKVPEKVKVQEKAQPPKKPEPTVESKEVPKQPEKPPPQKLPVKPQTVQPVKEYLKSEQYYKIVVQEGAPYRFIPVLTPTQDDIEIYEDDASALKSLSIIGGYSPANYYFKSDAESGLFTFKPIPRRINRVRKDHGGEDILEVQDVTISNEEDEGKYFNQVIQNGKPIGKFQPAANVSDRRTRASEHQAEVYRTEGLKYYERMGEGYVEVETPSTIEDSTLHIKDWKIEAPLYYSKWVDRDGLTIFQPVPRIGKRSKGGRSEVIEMRTTYQGIDGQHFTEKQEGMGRVTYIPVHTNKS